MVRRGFGLILIVIGVIALLALSDSVRSTAKSRIEKPNWAEPCYPVLLADTTGQLVIVNMETGRLLSVGVVEFPDASEIWEIDNGVPRKISGTVLWNIWKYSHTSVWGLGFMIVGIGLIILPQRKKSAPTVTADTDAKSV